MDLSAWRQRVYAGNLANVNTPGYRRKEVDFASELKKADGKGLNLKVTRAEHIGTATARGAVLEMREEADAGEPAGVDVEKEMVAVAENQLRFHLAAHIAGLRIQSLRGSIRGG